MRLELVVGHAPIPDRELRTASVKKFLPVAFEDMRAVGEIGDLEAKALSVPVHECPAQALSRQEALPAAKGQRSLVGVVAEGHRHLRIVLHHPLADREGQGSVDRGRLEGGPGIAPPAALEPDDLETRLRQLEARKRAGQAYADRNDVNRLQTCRHASSPSGRRQIGGDIWVRMHMAMSIFRDAHPLPVELDAVLIDEAVVGGVGAGETDYAPCDHVAVAAIDGVAEEALERALPEMREEHVGWHATEAFAAGLEAAEKDVLLVGAHRREGRPGRRQLLVDRSE